jgi:hypothetical protein
LTSGSQYKIKTGQQYWNGTKGTDGSIKLELYSTSSSDTYGLGVSASELEIQSAADIGFYAAGGSTRTKRMHIEGSNGNVGIGAGSPGAKLHVQTSHTQTDVTGANSNSTLNIANSGAGNGVYNAIKFAANQQDMYIASFNNNQQAARRLGFFLGSVAGDAVADERLSILGNGNVGIGTSIPSGRLTIANPTAYAPNTITTANTYIQLGSTDYGSGGSSNNNGKFMIGFGYTGGVSNTNSPAYIGFEETSTSGATKGDLTFYTRPATSDTAPTERMRIHDSGNVSLATGMTYGNKWHEVVFGGTGSGPTAITVQVDIAAKTTGQIFKVEAIFNHWNSDASNYTVAKKVKYFWTYSSTTSIVEHVDGVADRGGSSVGAWTVDKPSNTRLRVTKSAGTNSWPGEWYVRITSSCPITKV